MCSCEAHGNSALVVCTCVCEEHDHFFDSGAVVTRKAIRSLNNRIYALQQDMGQAITSIMDRLSPPEKAVKVVKGPDLDGGERKLGEVRPEESDGELLARLGTDATKWAEDFIRSTLTGSDDYEVGHVIGWFANAIEAGRMAGTSEAYAKNPVRPDDLDNWKDRAVVAERKLEYLKQAIANA